MEKYKVIWMILELNCGSNSHSSYLSFNKFKTKKIWREHNLITPDFEIYSDQSYQDLTKYYGKTFFIKDTCSGSSNNIFQIKVMMILIIFY